MDLCIQPVVAGKAYKNKVANEQGGRITFRAMKDVATFTKKSLNNKAIRNTFLGAIIAPVLAFFGFDQLMNKPSEAEYVVRENVFQKSVTEALKNVEKSPEKRKILDEIKKVKEEETKAIINNAVDELLSNNAKYKNIDEIKSKQIKDKMYEIANVLGFNFRMDESGIDYAIALLKQDFKSKSF